MEPGTSVVQSAPESEASRRRDERWQRSLLPLVTRMLVGLAIFFFTVSLLQLWYLERRMEQSPTTDLGSAFALLNQAAATSAGTLNAANVMVAASLEANALARRYHQANVVLMARVWTSYLGFVTGMFLALVGAVFVLARVQGTQVSLETKSGPVGGSLRTAAPGIVLAVLGVALMVATLFVRYDIAVSDGAVYSSFSIREGSDPIPNPPSIHFPSTSTEPEPKKR